MKKSIPVVLAIFITALLILFTSDYKFKPIDTLMKPPKVEGENLAIQLAFEEAVNDEYRLITPIKGEYHSAYTFFDLNNDDEDEVIVFYSKYSDVDLVRMNILSCDADGTWKSAADLETYHSEVQQIEFADLNADGTNEIIVGWGVYQNDLTKEMNVYMLSFDDENVNAQSIYSDTYYDFRVLDIDSDDITDILKISYNNVMDRLEYTASVLSYSDDALLEKSVIALDSSFSSITSVSSDYLKDEGKRRIFFDGLKYESGMITDCVYWDENNSALTRERRSFPPLGALSSRSTNISCRDINDDGIIEIPVEVEIPGSEVLLEGSESVKKQTVIKWTQLNNGKYSETDCTILNLNYGYGVKIEESWLRNLTIVNNLSTGMMTFYKIEYLTGYPEKGEALFSIKVVEADDSDDFLNYKYKYLEQNKNNYFYCRIYSGGEEMNLTKKDIKKMLFFDLD